MCRMTFAAAAAPGALVLALVVTRPMLARQVPDQEFSAELGTVAFGRGESLAGGVQPMLTTKFRS